MTRSDEQTAKRASSAALASLEPAGALLPIVSVVVVNYNYGRFLAEAVDSVFSQTYPNKECIVVDNASTDETPRVLADLEARHPDLIVIRRAHNDGQTPASLDGLAACTGQYVIFLDADDYLLPPCIETHIFVHLSMRPHIGLTSGDMLQVQGNHVVVATGEESNRHVRSGKGLRPQLVRPYRATEGWPAASVAENIADKVHYVPPLRIGWVWSPTSGLCYRRDALKLFADNTRLASLRTGTDLYFAFGCSGLSGSVLIDEPLFAYRIHGGNIFTAHAQLDRTLNFTVGGSGDSNVKAQLYLVDHLVEQAQRFTPNEFLQINLCVLIARVDRADIDPRLPRWARRSRAAQAIARNWDSFSGAVGPRQARLLFAFCARSLRSPAKAARHLPT
jgi:glycosyltransferase involved in cell wall biosynthesis